MSYQIKGIHNGTFIQIGELKSVTIEGYSDMPVFEGQRFNVIDGGHIMAFGIIDSLSVIDKTTTLEPPTHYDEEGFLFKIDRAFFIATRGTVVTGQVINGKASIGSPVIIEFCDGHFVYSEITKLEKFKENLLSAQKGDCVGMYLKDLTKEELDGAVRITTSI